MVMLYVLFQLPVLTVMASLLTGMGISITAKQATYPKYQIFNGVSGIRLISFYSTKRKSVSLRLQSAPMKFHVSCVAKSDTLGKVCEMVKRYFTIPDGTFVTGETTFAALGADSLDMLIIAVFLDAEFGIKMEDKSELNFVTVQDAADMVQKFVDAKST